MPQAIFDLTKRIEPGTWRYIGQRLEGIDLSEIPIAGTNIYEIYQRLGRKVYAVGGANVANVFVVERPPLRLLYVRPGYNGYRRLGLKVLSRSTWKVDFDHALGQRLAERLGYGYVLLLRVVKPRVNRAHGRFERPAEATLDIPPLCFADDRIRDKWIGRGPNFWRKRDPNLAFDPGDPGRHGLTLKQKGWWGFAMGVSDGTLPSMHLSAI
jgi:hypothetical protein